MRQCNAKSKRSQKRCQNPAMIGMNVCYHHGGALGSKKARLARKRAALKHGFYTGKSIEERKKIAIAIKNCKSYF